VVGDLNRLLRGWANYFCLGPVGRACRAVDTHVTARLRRWLRRKHKQRGRATARYPDQHLYETYGLLRLPVRARSFLWANAGRRVREPDAGDPHVRFDERDVETEQGWAREAPANEGAGQRIGPTYPTAPLLDSTPVGSTGHHLQRDLRFLAVSARRRHPTTVLARPARTTATALS